MIMLMLLLAFVVMSPIAVLVMFGMGQVIGVEFSPDDFSQRQFSYNQLPLIDYVVFKKTFEDETTPLQQSLKIKRLIKPLRNKDKVWHLVSESSSQIPSAECDARFLIGYLEKTDDDGANYWDTWNTEFPKSAKVFWPYIAELARDEMYLKVADVMRTAMTMNKDQPKKLKRTLSKSMAVAYLELGILDSETGNFERAKYRLGRSIEFMPFREAYQERAIVLKELGEASLSQADLKEAKTADELNPAGDP